MLYIVGRRQLEGTPHGQGHQNHEHFDAIKSNQSAVDQNAEAKSLKDFILKVPGRFVLTLESIGFQLPCPEGTSRNFSASKLVNVLTHFGRSRIFGGAHMPVMASVVFNGEVTVHA